MHVIMCTCAACEACDKHTHELTLLLLKVQGIVMPAYFMTIKRCMKPGHAAHAVQQSPSCHIPLVPHPSCHMPRGRRHKHCLGCTHVHPATAASAGAAAKRCAMSTLHPSMACGWVREPGVTPVKHASAPRDVCKLLSHMQRLFVSMCR